MNHKLVVLAFLVLIAGLWAVSVPVANKRTSHLPTYKGGLK